MGYHSWPGWFRVEEGIVTKVPFDDWSLDHNNASREMLDALWNLMHSALLQSLITTTSAAKHTAVHLLKAMQCSKKFGLCCNIDFAVQFNPWSQQCHPKLHSAPSASPPILPYCETETTLKIMMRMVITIRDIITHVMFYWSSFKTFSGFPFIDRNMIMAWLFDRRH